MGLRVRGAPVHAEHFRVAADFVPGQGSDQPHQPIPAHADADRCRQASSCPTGLRHGPGFEVHAEAPLSPSGVLLRWRSAHNATGAPAATSAAAKHRPAW